MIPGDLVYCIMPVPMLELIRIPYKHRCRPYAVVKKTDDGFYGYYTSSKVGNKKNCVSHMILNAGVKYINWKNEENRRYKSSFISFERIFFIPCKNIINYQGSLSEREFEDLCRFNDIKNNHRKNGFVIEVPNCNLKMAEWFVIRHKERLYLIEKMDNSLLYLLEMSDQPTNEHYKFYLNGKPFYIDLNKQVTLKNTRYQIVGYLNVDRQKELLTLKAEHKLLNKMVKKIEKQVVDSDNKEKLPNYYLEFELGTVFTDRFTDQSIMYLFSIRNQRFGIYDTKNKISPWYDPHGIFDNTGRAEDEEIYDVLEILKDKSVIVEDIVQKLEDDNGYIDFNRTDELPHQLIY